MYKKRKISLNSVASLIRFILCAIIWFVLVRYLIKKLGIEEFGLWSLLGMVTFYVGLLDLGVNQALVRYVAELDAKSDYKKLNNYISISLLLYFLILVLTFLILLFSRSWIVTDILKIDEKFWEIAKIIIILSITSVGILIIGKIFQSILEGLQKFVVSNILILFQTLMIAIGSYFFLENNFGLIGLAINNVIIYTLMLIIFLFVAKFYLKPLRFSITNLNWKEIYSLFSYSLAIQFSSIMGISFLTLTKIFITRYLSLSYVGLFEISFKILDTTKGIFTSLILPILPLASVINISRGKKEVAKLTGFVNTFALFFSLVAFAILCLFMPQILNIWLGNFDTDLIWSTRLMALPFFGSTLITGIYIVFQGIGLAKWNAGLQFMLMLSIPILYFAVKTGSYLNFILAYSLIAILPSIIALILYRIYFNNYPIWEFRHFFKFLSKSFSQVKLWE